MNKAREQPIIIIKKKGHGHGHHGGAWKVAFADFMTAMFAMFLVLWLVNQSSDVKSAIAGYFQDPLGRADEFGSSIMPGEGAQTQSPRPMTAQQVIDQHAQRILDEDHRCMAAIEAAWVDAYFQWERGAAYSPSASDLATIACRIDSATFAPADEDDIYEMLCEGLSLGEIVESFYETR